MSSQWNAAEKRTEREARAKWQEKEAQWKAESVARRKREAEETIGPVKSAKKLPTFDENWTPSQEKSS
jgi:hypothetical protein